MELPGPGKAFSDQGSGTMESSLRRKAASVALQGQRALGRGEQLESRTE